jgi:hypothetical protein
MLRIVAPAEARAPARCPQVALDQRHAGALHRHVGAGAHRDADVRLRERRGVVDAVAGHRDDAPLGLERFTASAFWSGSTPAMTSSMPSLRATASAVVRLSPVSITMRSPRRAARDGLGVVP